jgi:hypothetical protein
MAVDIALDRSIALGRDDGGSTPGGQDGVNVVAFVAEVCSGAEADGQA